MKSQMIQPPTALFRQTLRNFWPILIGMVVAFLGLAWVAYGATYNFIFNNTEQGDNSVANPSLSVAADGKVTKAGVPTPGDPKQELVQVATVPMPAAQAPTSVATTVSAQAEEPRTQHFRIFGGAGGYYDDKGSSLAPAASVAFFFTREIGLNAFAQYHSKRNPEVKGGLELEIVPIHIALGRIENLLEIALVGGANTFSTRSSDYYASDLYSPDANEVNAHAGARINLNLGNNWGLTAVARYNTAKVLVADAGLALRF